MKTKNILTTILLFSCLTHLYAQSNIYEQKKEKMLLVENGKVSPDFTYNDANDNKVSLSDFRGKYVMIDIWATWCKPCVEQIPYFDSVQENFEDKNIVFLSISIDDTKEEWKNFIEEHKLEGVQLWAGREETTIEYFTYFLYETPDGFEVPAIGVPRYVLIDKEGIIKNNKMPFPSKKNFQEILQNLR